MSYTFRPAVRAKTPLIIGIAGPTKSGKTYSAHRLAIGLGDGGTVAMINAEGPRGHQYADKFTYVACDLLAPFRPTAYTEALKAAAKLSPAVVIIDSGSHMHDGPGGLLEWHEELVRQMSGGDAKKAERVTFAAWVGPKAAENEFVYTMLSMSCPIILCFRAKEKIKIRKGAVEELGWQPIAGERVAFETVFTLMLPPHSKGVPDLAISEMREPFDSLVPASKPLDEVLGRRLAEWARGTSISTRRPPADPKAAVLAQIQATMVESFPGRGERETQARAQVIEAAFGVKGWSAVEQLAMDKLEAVVAKTDLSAPSMLEATCADFKAQMTAA